MGCALSLLCSSTSLELAREQRDVTALLRGYLGHKLTKAVAVRGGWLGGRGSRLSRALVI